MSTISDIFKSYDNALTQSRDRYTDLYAERIENGRQFYADFFHRLVVPFRPMFEDSTSRSFIKRHVERFFGGSQIDFVAIDGTCDKDAFTDFVVFFGGAYGSKGRVSLEGDPAKVRYEKWEMKRDVSMVAWVPVPFAELADVTGAGIEETFMVTDSDRVNLSSIHTSLMQLSEIYLAYNVARSSVTDCPKLIMLDQSLSGIMAATSHGVHTGLVGYPYDRRHLDSADVTVAFAHPINDEFKIPSSKVFGRHNAVIAEFHKRGTRQISVGELAEALGLTEDEIVEPVKRLKKDPALCSYDKSTRTLSTLIDCRESWAYTVSLFENICKRLFLDKDQSALTYGVPDPDDPMRSRRRWMSPDDIQFLIAVGLRALVETCWERRIMLVGVFKDSESRYLTRNYLGVGKGLAIYPDLSDLKVGLLPWTDRIYLETIPSYCDDEIAAPWASIEFDSTFMTLHLGESDPGTPILTGVRTRAGEIIAPERLFLRSLGQFFLSRSKKTPLMGHVVFIDRLAFPSWDNDASEQFVVQTASLGSVRPFVYGDRDTANVGQAIMMYLLNTLTRNHFPEVIGYPDPLHKADWGAKSMGRRITEMIRSSEIPFRSKPISKTLRSIRDEYRR